MLCSTRGIVVHSLKYSDTSSIVKILTERFGIRSYLIKGLYGKKSKTRPAHFQPMTLLDLVVYHREKHSLQTLKEVRLAAPYTGIPSDIRKSAILIFINELVYKSIREEEPNPGLFEFLWQTCVSLDEDQGNLKDHPVRFALQLSKYLGILPHNNHSDQNCFLNLREGHFQSGPPGHPQYLGPEAAQVVAGFLADPGYIAPATFSGNTLLETILIYYQIHLPGFKGMQSHHILHEVLA